MKKRGNGRVRVVAEFGSLDGRTVCRVRTVNADLGNTVRRENAALGFRKMLERALEERLTDRPFAVQFSFCIEPRKIVGRHGQENGTCWIDFRRRPCCTAVVLDTGTKIYNAIIGVCKKITPGEEK